MTSNRIFKIDIDIRVRDLDGRGHVNNAVYFSYFEYGRLRFYNSALHMYTLSEIPFILAATSCNFIRSITLTDRLQLQIQIKEIGTKSFTFVYQLVNSSDISVIYATGESVQVCFNYQKDESVPIPKEIRAKFSEYMKIEIKN